MNWLTSGYTGKKRNFGLPMLGIREASDDTMILLMRAHGEGMTTARDDSMAHMIEAHDVMVIHMIELCGTRSYRVIHMIEANGVRMTPIMKIIMTNLVHITEVYADMVIHMKRSLETKDKVIHKMAACGDSDLYDGSSLRHLRGPPDSKS
ncbi:hypothetical protein CDAR_410461 [Caerostris darwini]|uniref:Uncharacterized protein n=1 Tax=Caerostris darwini TaxID=1538125 RepID=A0AAV4MYS1_9ARAC|nr:hypothetical protein CDAR_410461 [Caerostris darwini]